MFDFVIGGLLGSYGSQRQYYNNDNDLRMIRCFSGPTHMPAAPGGAEGCWHLCRALFLVYNYKCAPFYYVCIFSLRDQLNNKNFGANVLQIILSIFRIFT